MAALDFREAASLALAASLSFLRSILGFSIAAGAGLGVGAGVRVAAKDGATTGVVGMTGAAITGALICYERSIYYPVIAAAAFSI